MVILDTCAVLEIVKQSPGLSMECLKKIDKGSYILSVSFTEIACKIKLNKLNIGITMEELFFEYSTIPSINIIDIGVQEWLESINLEWPDNRDPVDRLIAAYAMRKKIPIVTSDKKIKQFYSKVIW